MSGRNGTTGHPCPGVPGRVALLDGHEILPPASGLGHAALFYRSPDEYLSGIAAMLRHAAQAAAPLHVAVPGDALPLVRRALGPRPATAGTPAVVLTDMTALGGNPARIIPAGRSFADQHRGGRACFLWEPAWPARSTAELCEVARHEALCNLAFRQPAATVLCLYDAARLGHDVIANAERTHPVLIASGQRRPSPGYLGPGGIPEGCDDPFPPPGPGAESLAFGGRLRPVRQFTSWHAWAAGLAAQRAADLTLAVGEIAANALSHAGGGVIRCWCTDDELLCQIEDTGHITDPLAGRQRRPPDAPGGHGLWLVNEVCDLVQRRSGPAGTSTRLHMRRAT